MNEQSERFPRTNPCPVRIDDIAAPLLGDDEVAVVALKRNRIPRLHGASGTVEIHESECFPGARVASHSEHRVSTTPDGLQVV